MHFVPVNMERSLWHNSTDSICGLQKCYLSTFYPGDLVEGLVSQMEATDNVTYFYFGLSFKLSADWMMLKRCLNRDRCKYFNKPAALDSTQNRGIMPEKES